MRRLRSLSDRPVPRWMAYTSGALSVLLVGFVALMVFSVRGFVEDVQHLRFHPAETIRFIPDPVGSHPVESQSWFLVVGDSISAGISPATLGGGANHSWVGTLASDLHRAGFTWQPDDLACPSENTRSYYSGCPLNFTNPLLGGRPQHDAALRDIKAHRANLKFMVLELGANDLFGMKENRYISDTAGLINRLQGIADELRQAAPGVPLFIADVYNPFAVDRPSSGGELAYINQAIRTLAAAEQAYLVDFANAINPGGTATKAQLCTLIDCVHQDIHPTLAGEQALADAARQTLDRAGVLQILLLL